MLSLIWDDEFMKSKDFWMNDSPNSAANGDGFVLKSRTKTVY